MKKGFWINHYKDKLLDLKNFKQSQNHAYLILGPYNIGKLTYAYKIAQTLLCDNDKGSFCGKCQACILTNKERHPDLTIIAPKGNKNPKILIDQIKKLSQISQTTSYYGGYKVFIVDQADKLTIPAQNALLKTLEEPSKKTLILLISDSEKLILPTILSRCQRIKLSALPRNLIKKYLAKKYGLRKSDLISRYALGRPGLAFKISENKEILDDYIEKFLQIKKTVMSKSFHYRFKKASQFADFKIQGQIIDFFEIFFRDLLHLKIGIDRYLVNINLEKDMIKIANCYNLGELLIIIKKIEKVKKSLQQNVNPKLAFENLMLII